MAQTTVSQVISPVLLTEAVQGAFASKTAFAGSLAQSLGVVAINDGFPMAGKEAIGQTVRVPYFSSIGEFQDNVSDGTAATPVQMSQTSEDGTVIRGTLSWEMSRWARAGSNIQGGADIYEEASRQAVQSGMRYMDRKIIDAAVSGNNRLVLDKYNSTAPRLFDWDLICDGLGMFNDNSGGNGSALDDVAAFAVSSRTMTDVFKMKDASGRPLFVDAAQGGKPSILGKPLIVSDRLPLSSSGLTAVSTFSTSGTPAVITVAASANREGGTGPVRPIDVVVQGTTPGARGTAKFRVSIDGGATFGAVDQYTTAATVALIDPLDPAGGLLGVTLTIGVATWVGTSPTVDHYFTFKSILKHTSLILKKGALSFWYNRAAMEVATIPVPLADTVQAACHMYCVAYRYKRLPGMPTPGVCELRHNAGGL